MLKRLFLLALHVVLAPVAGADTYVPHPWYQQVARASFVGVVQCEVAGVVAAKYRVIESWKGAPVGSLLTIDEQLRRTATYTPFAVCGEKYLACIYSTSYLPLRPSDVTRFVDEIYPYWWRDSKAEYHTQVLPRLLRLPVKRSDDLGAFGIWGKKVTVKAYRESVLTYLSLPQAAQEDRALRPFVKSILRVYPQYERDQNARKAMEDLAARVDSLGLDSLVSAIVTLELEHPKANRGYAQTMLTGYGRERTLAALRSTRGLQAFPGDTLDPRHPLRQVADQEIPKTNSWTIRVPAYSDSARDAHRAAFATPWKQQGFLKAFAWLTEHDPEPVMGWLERDSLVAPRNWFRTTPYNLTSYFGWRNASRESILRRMLDARSPTARVAGAVYLTFADSISGTRALRDLSGLSGFAGAWAATVLASQGDRQAVSRALEAFHLIHDDEREYGPSRSLQARLLVLLSNSARSSGLKMPDVEWAWYFHVTDKRFRKGAKDLTEWWRKNGHRIQVVDPWRPLYSSQRVD
jgi:hypothetical protein